MIHFNEINNNFINKFFSCIDYTRMLVNIYILMDNSYEIKMSKCVHFEMNNYHEMSAQCNFLRHRYAHKWLPCEIFC